MIQLLARSTLLRALLTAGILAYLLSRIDPRDALDALLAIPLSALALVMVLVAIDRAVMVARWLVLLRASDAEVSMKSAAWIYLVSSFIGSFLPAGVGGDAARAYTLAKRTDRGSEAVASVAVDRMAGMLSIVILGLTGLMLWTERLGGDIRRSTLIVAAIVATGIAAAVRADDLIRLLIPARFQAAGPFGRAARLADAMARYRSRPVALATVLMLSFAVQLLRILQAYLLGLGLGLDVPFGYYLVFMPIGLLMLLLPVSVSGFGLPQGVIVWLLRPVGVPDAQSFALSTLIVLTGLAGTSQALGFTSAVAARRIGAYGTSLRREVPRQGGRKRAEGLRQRLHRQAEADPPDRPDLPLHVRLRRTLRDVQQLDARGPEVGHDARRDRPHVRLDAVEEHRERERLRR